VKLSAQAEELEKPFRVLICRHWQCDLESFIEERFHCRFGREEGIFFGTWAVLGIPIEAGRVLIFLAVYCLLWASVFIIKIVWLGG
jgi:hypothetical protein